ncbi:MULTISPECIES: small ribosomal subunit Rsm22 family protein [unclassified Methylosinus]|uniref:small ribosomal subunit Rsm22 family protein n=1 Tax=unclassified Methylosinus TaxID=2624500 RepID=UPI0004643B25|nr:MULTISPECIES: small ribosomal subunit Rsm22 family protein [unclassified Methylosinus]
MTRISTAPPQALTAALERLLDERSRRALAERAARISALYRSGGTTAQAILCEDDALAYALYRLPATYAATIHVLGRLAERAPDFSPRRMLDLGAGLGTASLAARALWPQIDENVLLDRSEPFLALARRLAGEALEKARIVAGDLSAPPDLGAPFDLVVASYASTEIAEDRLDRAMDAAWRLCAGTLILVEPGTPRDYARLMRMRARLIASGARVSLPCPHSAPCPLEPPDWCHFSVRLARSRDHKLLKGADAPFEDEKFAYLAATREEAAIAPAPARMLARPEVLKHGLRIKLCTMAGIEEVTVAKRDKAVFAPIKKKDWGDEVVQGETPARE